MKKLKENKILEQVFDNFIIGDLFISLDFANELINADQKKALHSLGKLFTGIPHFKILESINLFKRRYQTEFKKDEIWKIYDYWGRIFQNLRYFLNTTIFFKEALAENPNDENFYHYWGLVHIDDEREDYLQAINIYEKGMKCNPINLDYYFTYGEVLRYLKESRKAIKVFKLANKLHKHNFIIYLKLAELYLELNDKLNVEKNIDIAKTKTISKNLKGYYYTKLAKIFMRLGNTKQALYNYEKGTEYIFRPWELYYEIGEIHEENSNFKLAIENYNKSLSNVKKHDSFIISVIHQSIGICYEKLGDLRQAYKSFISSDNFDQDPVFDKHIKQLEHKIDKKLDRKKSELKSDNFTEFPEDIREKLNPIIDRRINERLHQIEIITNHKNPHITNFNEIKIYLSDTLGDTKINFCLSSAGKNSSMITISNTAMSFLLYLCYERSKKDKDWLDEPTTGIRKEILEEIDRKLTLPEKFSYEIEKPPSVVKTWIWDYANKIRRRHVSTINEVCSRYLDGKLIIAKPFRGNRKGRYYLHECITKITIN